jgi:hypothetical protein
MLNWFKRIFVKEVIVEKIKYVGTEITCNAKECMENEKGKCSICSTTLVFASTDGVNPLFLCEEYCKYDQELITDTNKIISGVKL